MNCGKEYGDDAEELVDGCSCGSSLFLYQKEQEDDEPEVEEDEVMQEIDEFLQDVKDDEKDPHDSKIRFDLQSIRVLEEGVYEIDLKKLLEREPLIVEVKDSKYFLHLASVFTQGEDKSLSLKELDEEDQPDEEPDLSR